MKLKIEKAEELVKNGINGQKMPQAKINHSFAVANAAKKIAEKCGLDGEEAYVLGLVHDIGCHFNKGIQHPFIGYKLLKELGYEKEANICLTHSFLQGDPNCTADGPIVQNGVVAKNNIIPWECKEESEEVLQFLQTHKYTACETIINLCDLMCTDKIVGLDKRLIDLIAKKGAFSTTQNHIKKAKEIEKALEEIMGCTMLDLFPEIVDNIKQAETYRSSMPECYSKK